MGSSVFETTVTLGCDACPNRCEYKIGRAAVVILSGTDSTGTKLRVTEKNTFTGPLSATIDGNPGTVDFVAPLAIVNTYNDLGGACESVPSVCDSADSIDNFKAQLEQRIVNLARNPN